MGARSLGWLLFVASVTWHLWWVLAPPDPGAGPLKRTLGRDFATYYYAADVASKGGDPWDTSALIEAARQDGTRDSVHPFFYPPPALLFVAWAPSLDLRTAFAVWYGLQEICVVLCGLVLFAWWRELGSATPWAIAAWIALCWGIPYGLAMGQINPLVLFLALAGLFAAERDRPELGGALVGAACMVKMSPALFVAWWLLHRRWREVSAAVGTAIGLSLVSVGLVEHAQQLRFYTEVLSTFSSGDYNGLVVRISMFANHSLPNLVDQILPGTERLSGAAQAVSALAALAMVGGLAWAFRDRPTDPWATAAQVCAIAVVALLIPVYTFEHHLVQAIPAGVLVTLAVVHGRVGRGWVAVAVLGTVGLAWPHPHLKQLAAEAGPAGWLLQELKTFALLALLAGSVRVARSDPAPSKV